MKNIIRVNKKTNETVHVEIEYFLNFVSSFNQCYEESLSSLIKGYVIQDNSFAFYIPELHDKLT